ncbi:MAG: hypothetical protein ACK4YQ_16960 [Phenylobacterium sp.]|uniref:hypothetical protein n=1 Tax=Phenylobacterium sp. TaxID=1871053 RepID=UPI00391C56D9
MILVEADAAKDSVGTIETLRLSDAPFVTAPTDAPPNVTFLPALKDPGRLGVAAYSDGRTSGGTRLETGEIVVANADGRFDRWLAYSFDGRQITIRQGDPGGAYPADFPIIVRATARAVQGDLKRLVIQLRDKQHVFETRHLPNTYAGSNALPEGFEGTANDLKGQRKPRLYGSALNIPAPCVNTSKLTFQVSDGPVFDISAVYDMGVALTKGADYATKALLNAAAGLSAGTFYTCKAEGLFRLGGAPAGLITADAQEGASAAERTVAQVLARLAIAAGVPAGEISSADLANMDAAVPAVVGVWVEGETTTQAAMDQVAASAGAYYAFDGDGVLRIGRLVAPASAPILTLGPSRIRALERRQARDNGLPVFKVSVRHTRLWAVQGTDVAGAVSAARRALLAEEYRTAVAEDAAIKDQFLLADEISIDTLLTSEADAQAEADRLLALHKVRRDVFDVSIDPALVARAQLQLMDVVELRLPRFGLSAGKLFRVIGKRLELARKRVVLTVWG